MELCRVNNPELMLPTMINGCLAMAQRILPREKHYIIELGYGREIMNCYLDLFFWLLKKKNKGEWVGKDNLIIKKMSL